MESLWVFSCCTNTWSPIAISECFAPPRLSVYIFDFVFCSASRSRTSRSYIFVSFSTSLRMKLVSGIFPLNFRRNNSSAGLRPIDGCGKLRYCRRYFRSSVLQSWCWACAIRSLLSNDLFCRSTSPFAWAHLAVVNKCSIPFSEQYCSNSAAINWDPLFW